jgi:signal transduction histidine kinase
VAVREQLDDGNRSRRRYARLAWGAWVLISTVAGLSIALVALTRSEARPDWHPWTVALGEQVSFIAFALPGAFVAARRPRNPAGWLLLLSGFGAALDGLAHAYGLYAIPRDLVGGVLAAWVSNWAFAVYVYPVFFLLLLFPDGRLPTPRWQFTAWFIGASAVLVVPCAAFVPGPIDRDYFPAVPNPVGNPMLAFAVQNEGMVSLVLVACPLVLATASLLRRVAISNAVARQQIKWVAFAVLVSVVMVLLTAPFDSGALGTISVDLASVLLSAAIAVAIVRYGLFDIDRVLSRSLLYAVLTACLAGVYAGVVSLLELVLQSSFTGVVALLAAASVAAALQPLQGLLQRLVSRMIYGLRDDPYAVLAGLGQRLEATTGPEHVLPQAAATVAEALRLPYAAVELHSTTGTDGPALPTARYGTEVRDLLRIALVHQGEEVGVLVLGARAPGEPFSAGDLRLLADVARHTAQAAVGVRLTLALLHSRQQLIAARAQERRRLGRELHDGVNSALSEVVWGLQAARKWLHTDPAKTEELLTAALVRAHEGIDVIRRVSAGLRSPVDAIGLPDAVRAYLERFPLPTDADLPDEFPELPAAVEEATYWILVEALTNALRHARASHCLVRLEVEANALTVTVTDNGRGLPEPLRPGVGLGSMRERATEISGTCEVRSRQEGGTEVVVRLPRTLPT